MSIPDLPEDDFLSERTKCPVCLDMTTYGEMIWLNGKCVCPKCYEAARKSDTMRSQEDDETAYNNWVNGW